MTKTSFATILIVLITTGCFHKKPHITVLFDRVDGLTENSAVFTNGLQIGRIKHFDFFKQQVAVDITLERDIKIPVQSTFIVKNNVLGISYIDVVFSNAPRFLAVKDTVYGEFQHKALMDDLLSDSTKRKDIEKSLEKIASGIGEILKEAKSVKDTTIKY